VPTYQDTSVHASVDVPVSPERAFALFTHGFDTWWNRGHHLLRGELGRVWIEPHAGGGVWEESVDGERCRWGQVLTWEPPTLFAFSWQIGTDWAVPAADAPASTVTVTFTGSESGTSVELVHSRLDAHGQGWQEIRQSISADGGWNGLLRLYAAAV
jgi:uncharacterized protein YndB with AHSA1/START domain